MNAPTAALVALLNSKLPEIITELLELKKAVLTQIKTPGSIQFLRFATVLLEGFTCVENLIELMFKMATPDEFEEFISWFGGCSVPNEFQKLIRKAFFAFNANDVQIHSAVFSNAYTAAYDETLEVYLVDELAKNTMHTQGLFICLARRGFKAKQPVTNAPLGPYDYLKTVSKKISAGTAPTPEDEETIVRLFTNQSSIIKDEGLLELAKKHDNLAWFKLFVRYIN